MKKVLVLSVILLFSVFSVFSLTSPVSPFFENPARLFFYNQNKTFGSDLSFGVSPSFGNDEPFLSTPYMGLRTEFTSKYAQAGLSVDISYADRNAQQESVYYNINDTVTFNVAGAYGYRNVGAGFMLEAGARLQRLNCPISYSNSFYDFFNQSLFAEFDRVSGSESTNLTVGVGVEVGDVSFYILSPSVMRYSDNQTHFSIEEIYRNLGLGLYYTSDRFGTRGRLRPLVFDAAVSVSSAFEETVRTLELSGALTLQLSRDMNICLTGSYYGPLFNSEVQKTYFGSASFTADKMVFSFEATVPSDSQEHCFFTFRTSLLF